ncbi:MAG TPA: hypothetical protein VL860_13960 [Planctomycetota bacterium]|nr:hypothetical protein [Planctomycetota bacterium]
MVEANPDRDELLLMRHLDGRLGAAETAALKQRLAAEPALREKLNALELENDFIAGAVSVPDDVELAEPVMMAIIDQALKDPKRQPAERRWWKPVLLSMSAAAAVALAVLSIYMAGNEEKSQSAIVQSVLPDKGSVVSYSSEKPNAPASVLSSGAEIRRGDTLGSAGGAATLQLLEGVTFHLDHNTRLRLIEALPHQPVQFELLAGAVIVEYQRPIRPASAAANDSAIGVTISTADRRLQVDLKSGRVLIEPLSVQAGPEKSAEYVVYMPAGNGLALDPASRAHQQVLTDGTQIRWPANTAFSRTVHSDSLVCDLLTGWQSERTFAPDKWWQLHELRYDGLDRAWPLDWAGEIADGLHTPSFLKQAQSLEETLTPAGDLAATGANADQVEAVWARWQEMSNTLEDNAAYQQLESGRRLTWDMLSVKANLMAYRAARQLDNRAAADLPLKRLATHLRTIETQAAKTPEEPHVKGVATWLRMESDLLDEQVPANIAARYQAFATEYPTAVESMALQLKKALLQPAGDARLAALNLAWQHCHAFQVHMEAALQDPKDEAAPQKQWRLLEIQAAILSAIADQLYAQGLASEGDELVRTVDYVGLGQYGPAGYRSAGAPLFNTLVLEAVKRAEQELAEGRLDQIEPLLTTHLPAPIAAATLREVDLNNPSVPVQPSTAERWARCYDAWLTATGKLDAQKKFRDQAKLFLPEPAVPAPLEDNRRGN